MVNQVCLTVSDQHGGEMIKLFPSMLRYQGFESRAEVNSAFKRIILTVHVRLLFKPKSVPLPLIRVCYDHSSH